MGAGPGLYSQRSFPRRNRAMKRILAGLMLTVLAGAGSMVAQDGYHHDRDVRHDYYERRQDRRDVRRDEHKINRDRRDLRHDRYEGNYAAARRDRRDLR